MRFFNSARKYHQATKFSFNDVKQVYHEFPPENKALPVKQYPGKKAIVLPSDVDLGPGNLIEDLKRSAGYSHFHLFKDQSLTLPQMSHLLYLTNGVTLTKVFGAKRISLRAAPSASASYPVEIYVAARNVSGLLPGLYYFHPIDHQLIPLQEGDYAKGISQLAFGLSFIEKAPAILIFSSVYSRNYWRYQDRAFRYSLQDAGYIFENLVLAGSSLGLAVNLVGDFVDPALNQLLMLDPESEGALMIAAIGEAQKAISTEIYTFGMPPESEDHLSGEEATLPQTFYKKSMHFHPGPELATVKVTLPFRKAPSEMTAQPKLISLPEPVKHFSESTSRVISRRRSIHNFLRISITQEELSTLLSAHRKIPALYNFPAFFTYLAVQDVQELTNGLYCYHPVSHQLELLKKGTFRGDISYLTLAQDAVFNCSVAFFFAVDFSEVSLFSNRGYRYAHFNIGMLSETIYLTATALELGARGIGNFFDDDIAVLFNLNSPDQAILGGVIVGKA